MDNALVFCVLIALAGVWTTLIAYGVIGTKPGESATVDKLKAQFGGFNKVAGPMVIAAGVIGAVTRLVGAW
jgi:hypothetical protein